MNSTLCLCLASVEQSQYGLKMAKVVKIDEADEIVNEARALLASLESYRARLALAVRARSLDLLHAALDEAQQIGIALEAELEARCVHATIVHDLLFES